MLPFGDHKDAAVLSRQEGACILLALVFIPLVTTAVAWKLPPGEAFPLAQQVDTEIGSYAIQPLAQALPVPQLLPMQTRPQEDFLRRISSIVLIAEQAVHIGIDWSPEPLVEQGESLPIVRWERQIAPWSSCRRLP